MPGPSGGSALTTVSPIRCSPSERSESRCPLVPPILDLVWVIRRSAICRPQPQLVGSGAVAAAARALSIAAGGTPPIGRAPPPPPPPCPPNPPRAPPPPPPPPVALPPTRHPP